MYIAIHKPKSMGKGGNRGSSADLIDYLSKEDNRNDLGIIDEIENEEERNIVSVLLEKKELEESILSLENKISSTPYFDDDTYFLDADLLEHYKNELEKVNDEVEKLDDRKIVFNLNINAENQTFFNGEKENISKELAQKTIDEQSKGLEKKDSKFFMITVNPDQKELQHLLKDITPNYENISSTSELTKDENLKFQDKIKDYTHSVMDEYAKEFNRVKKDGSALERKDLVYVAKIENNRTYTSQDREVKFNREINKEIKNISNNPNISNSNKTESIRNLQDKLKLTNSGQIIRADLPKEGLQTHVHIVVSRQDKDKQFKLSPLANSKGQNNHQLNGKDVTIGFNRTDFAIKSQQKFDEQFNYQRPSKDMTAVRVQNNRNENDNKNVYSSMRRLVKDDGKVDVLEGYKLMAKGVGSIAEVAMTGKLNLQKIDPSTLAKVFGNEISPTEKLRQRLSEINPKELATQKIKQAITKGGLEI